MSIIDDSHAVLWTWDEPVPLTRPSMLVTPPSAFAGYRLAVAIVLSAVLVGLLTLAVLVLLGPT